MTDYEIRTQIAQRGYLTGQDVVQFLHIGVPILQLLSNSLNKDIKDVDVSLKNGLISHSDVSKTLFYYDNRTEL